MFNLSRTDGRAVFSGINYASYFNKKSRTTEVQFLLNVYSQGKCLPSNRNKKTLLIKLYNKIFLSKNLSVGKLAPTKPLCFGKQIRVRAKESAPPPLAPISSVKDSNNNEGMTSPHPPCSKIKQPLLPSPHDSS